MALVGYDERIIRHVTALQIRKQLVEIHSLLEAEPWICAFLHIREIDKRVVLHGIQLGHSGLRLGYVGHQPRHFALLSKDADEERSPNGRAFGGRLYLSGGLARSRPGAVR